MHRLKKLDKVAYVRFAVGVHGLQDVQEFMSELKKLAQGSRQEIVPSGLRRIREKICPNYFPGNFRLPSGRLKMTDARPAQARRLPRQ